MRRLNYTLLLAVLLLMLLGITASGAGPTTPGPKLPSGFTILVPPGAKLTYQNYANFEMMAEVSFNAEKRVGNDLVRYSATVRTFAKNDLWPMMEQNYRAQVDGNADQKLKEWGKAQSNTADGYSPPAVVNYPWGKGITQRTVRHYIGAGNAPDRVMYRCAYYGLSGYTYFEASVEGVADKAEADKWAASLAAKAAKTNLGNVAD